MLSHQLLRGTHVGLFDCLVKTRMFCKVLMLLAPTSFLMFPRQLDPRPVWPFSALIHPHPIMQGWWAILGWH
jgi:hypothetical protein